jgi:uncharacterized repeat protein (TIGR02543 family)
MKIMSYSYKSLLCILLLLTTNALKAIEGFSLIPAGAFTMGNSVAEDTDITDAPTRTVALDAYYIGKYEVTKAEWDEVRTWAVSNGYTDLATGGANNSLYGEDSTNFPIRDVSWYDVVKWCNARSEKEGVTPIYYTDTTQTTIYKTGNIDITNAQVKWGANGYRLPTEAEWEKAARGGLNAKRFPLGDIISFEVSNYLSLGGLNYDAAFMSGYRPPSQDVGWPYIWRVGSFGANSFGLHEMAGNLSEWCWDWYGVYVLGSQADPYGATYGTSRILRGGSWDADARYCRVANRNSDAPSNSSFSTGFRVIRRDVDSDSDGLFDWVETNTGIYISKTNTGTNSNNPDSDGDGMRDGVETNTGIYMSAANTGTNPNIADADIDGDGLLDVVETNTGSYVSKNSTGTDPIKEDTDGDGMKDGVETNTGVYVSATDTGTDPNNLDSDTDGDGFLDFDEVRWGSNPNERWDMPNFYVSFYADPESSEVGHVFSLRKDFNFRGDINGWWSWGGGYIPLRSLVQFTATPERGYLFVRWEYGAFGNTYSTSNPLEVRVYEPGSFKAIFVPDLFDSDGDGLTNYAELVTYQTNPNALDSDEDGYPDAQEIQRGSNPNDNANHPLLMLNLAVFSNGAIAGSGGYETGSIASVTATPNAGYIFAGWTGEASGTTNPLSITMDADKVVGATFSPDLADSDGDGLSNHAEIVTHGSNPNLADSNGDGLRDGLVVALGRTPSEDVSGFVSALMANRTELGLHTTEDITDMRVGSMMIESAAGANKLQFRMKMQKSSDLQNWQDDGNATFEMPVEPLATKRFYRFGVK